MLFFFRFEFRFVFIILDSCIVAFTLLIVFTTSDLHLIELAVNSFFIYQMLWEVWQVVVKAHVFQMAIPLIILALNFLNDIFYAILKLGLAVFKFVNDLVRYSWLILIF